MTTIHDNQSYHDAMLGKLKEQKQEKDQGDQIEKPPHYVSGSIEAIDYMKDSMSQLMFMGYLEGAIKKYLHRYRHKGKPLEDLKKARWYLDRLIETMEGKEITK